MATFIQKELLFWLTIRSLCIMSICDFGCFPFGFEGGTLVLMAPVPGHCLHIATNVAI